ncbi:MAG: discoidin domain-containing protein, partial [Lentisphaerae bacterium]|nr:discoidin domain-containing protein [Lentisphaerota bacterium]
MKLLVHFRFLSLLCTLLVLTATEISALDIQWSGYQAKAPSAPTVSEISLPNQTRGARIEASSDGAYQGAVGTLAKPVNLEDFRLIEFSIRHNITSGKISFSIMLFCKPGMVHGRFTVPTSQWNQVSIPLDVSSFSGRRDTSVIFGELSSIRITPFDAMDTAGKFLEIADFRLLPKVDEKAAMPIKVMNYFHNNPPSSGEKDNTVLTDGDLTENVHFRQYTENPDIVFDLGGRFTIDEIVVSSNAAPSHNYSELTICSSYDGKEWRPSGAIKNEAEGTQARIVKNKYVGDDRKMIGRYFRIQAARPRSDFSVYLSEISFFGHPPTPDEIAKAAESNYDTGAPMPLRTVEHYVELKKNDLQLWISRKNGVINGVFCGGRLIVERLTPQYTLQSRTKDTVVFGNKDVVQSIHAEDSQVTVITSNPGLPGLEVRRTWQVQGNALIEKVTLVNQSMKERMFLRMATEVILAQSFRNHGFYEMPASALAAEMFRMSASEVLMDRAMTNIPTIAFENDKERLTLWHTRYRFNDQFTYMDLGTEEDNLQVFRANGWLLTAATFVPADGKEQSYETRFAFTSGRLLKAFEEYQALPEVSAFRSQIKRPAWLRDIRAIISFGWDGTYPGSMQRLMKNYAGAFSHRGTLYEPTLYDLDGIWGDLLTQGEIRGWFGNRQTPEELQEKIKMFRASDPRFKVGYYTWFWSAFPWSTPVKNHPEWFVKKLRNGANASWFPGVNVNYLRFWGIKESRDEAAKQVIRAVDFYEQDGWYLDGGKSGVYAKDWETMRIDDPLGQTAFYDTVRKGIQKGNPNRVVFFNHSENPLGDLGFLESFGGTLTTDWRRGAVLMWKFKLYSYRDPLRYGVYIYWLPQVDHAFKNYLVGIGVMPSYLSRHFKAEDLPYIAARYEIRQAQITEAGVTPDWRFDEKETLECMALNQGTNGWLYMQYHGEEKAEKKVSVEIAPLGLTDSGKPIYAWLYHIKDAQKFHSKLSEPQIAKAYRETGWIADRAVSVQYLGKFPYAEQFSQQIEFAPGEGKVLMLTQLPAVVMSIEDEPSHYRLSGQPGITVEAASD